jgi:N-acyl-L-homoserine lactone synthetase
VAATSTRAQARGNERLNFRVAPLRGRPSLEAELQAAARARATGLRAAFEAQYRVVPATTPELRDAAFALRHDVYAGELGFEPVRADGLERDAYDDAALHHLLLHRATGEWAGCVRIILADACAPEPLPCETVDPPLLDGAPIDPATLDRARLGEISRLTVAPAFRRRRPGGVRELPAALGISLLALAATADAGLDSALCMMMPALHAQLGRYGIHLTQLSPLVDYHGGRALFHLAPERAALGIAPELRGMLATVREQVSARGPASARHAA